MPLRELITNLGQETEGESRGPVAFLGRLARQFGSDIEVDPNLLDRLTVGKISRAEAFRLVTERRSKRGSTHASGTDGREAQPKDGICISPRRSTRKRVRR